MNRAPPKRHALVLAALVLAGIAGPLAGQDPAPAPPAPGLFVFLDCHVRACDFDHFRREIGWVNWMRDRQDADLHLLITGQSTAAGGTAVTLDYIGLRRFAGLGDTLLLATDPTDTEAEVRDALTRTLALGLGPFAVRAGVDDRVLITALPAGDQPRAAVAATDDPWNLWVFNLGLSGSADVEQRQEAFSVGGRASANRTSEAFKIEWDQFAEYNREEFEVDSASRIEDESHFFESRLLMVWSLNDHWSLGGQSRVSGSTFSNRDFSASIGPAIEYNIFPYRESTRKSVTFGYIIEAVYNDYDRRTVTGVLSETVTRHRLEIEAGIQQPWGEIHGSLSGTQYFHDLAAHRIDLGVSTEVRVFRGLGVELDMEFARTKDQFFLPAVGATPEEILLERRELETDYRVEIRLGLNYRFGSRFANIVNSRFD